MSDKTPARAIAKGDDQLTPWAVSILRAIVFFALGAPFGAAMLFGCVAALVWLPDWASYLACLACIAAGLTALFKLDQWLYPDQIEP